MAILVAAALVIAGCGDEDGGGEEPGPAIVDIGSLLADPEENSGRELRLSGTATSLGEDGFILEDATGAIAVIGFETPVGKVDQEELVITGRVSELDRFQVRNLRRSAAEAGASEALELATIEPGAAYIELVSLSGEGGG